MKLTVFSIQTHRQYMLTCRKICQGHQKVVRRTLVPGVTCSFLEIALSFPEEIFEVVNAHLNDLPVKFSVCVNEGQDKLPTMYWLP